MEQTEYLPEFFSGNVVKRDGELFVVATDNEEMLDLIGMCGGGIILRDKAERKEVQFVHETIQEWMGYTLVFRLFGRLQ